MYKMERFQPTVLSQQCTVLLNKPTKKAWPEEHHQQKGTVAGEVEILWCVEGSVHPCTSPLQPYISTQTARWIYSVAQLVSVLKSSLTRFTQLWWEAQWKVLSLNVIVKMYEQGSRPKRNLASFVAESSQRYKPANTTQDQRGGLDKECFLFSERKTHSHFILECVPYSLHEPPSFCLTHNLGMKRLPVSLLTTVRFPMGMNYHFKLFDYSTLKTSQ